MGESDIQTKFTGYIEDNIPDKNIAWELKFIDLSKRKSLPFRRIAEHQKLALLAVETKGLYWKIPDMASIGGYASPKPFDCFYMKGYGYIVPCFYVPRKRKTCYLIRITDYLRMEESADRKSFTENMCKEHTEYTIEL